jgi:hypothetical protein
VAVRDRPVGLRGPLRSWVTRAEARLLEEELAAVETTADLYDWAYATSLKPPDGTEGSPSSSGKKRSYRSRR